MLVYGLFNDAVLAQKVLNQMRRSLVNNELKRMKK
jgi:hypothetical protein